MKQKSLNILLALSALSWGNVMAQSATVENIMPAAATDPATDSFDLYIRDNVEDTGLEPNTTTEVFWESPDLWYRNEKDGGLEHEMPYYDYEEHDRGYLYIRITNRGTKDFIWNKEKPQYLNIYYAFSTAFPILEMFKGTYVHPFTKYINGRRIYSQPIQDTILANSSIIYRIVFPLDDLRTYQSSSLHDYFFNYLAIISDSPSNFGLDESETTFQTVDIIGKRKNAQRGEYNVYVDPRKVPDDLLDSIRATIPVPIDSIGDYDGMTFEVTDIIPYAPTTTTHTQKNNSFSLPSISTMQGDKIIKPENENVYTIDLTTTISDVLTIQYKIPCTNNLADKYKFRLIKRDETTGTIIGGTTFTLNMTEVKAQIAQRRAENTEKKNNNTPHIESVYPSPAKDLITVKLSGPIEEEEAYIRAQAITDSRIWIDTPIRQEESQLQVDISPLPAGATSIQLILNKNLIDSNIILKK